MLATGGTIACRQTGHGLAPALTGEELLEFIPELKHICKVTVLNPMSVDSTDMTAEHRLRIARVIWDNRDGYDGFVITHGTDTLAYTAALFSHVLRAFGKPVILTGAQRPMGAEESDAEGNLLGAFRSINAPADGIINNMGKVIINHRPECVGEPAFIENVDASVVLMKLTPDLDPTIIDFLGRYNKVIIEGFGSGGVPTRLEKVVQKLILSGTRVYLTTQCLSGGADLHKYKVGRRAEAMGAVCLGDRTTEDALAAVMCGEL